VHLAGVYLIGIGAVWIAGVVHRWWASRAPSAARWVPAAAAAGAVVLALLPAWAERVAYERQGAVWIDDQARADAVDGAAFAALVDRARREGPGRIYSSLRSNGALEYRIGQVPTFVALLDLDADAVGFTRPTWSVLSGVEHRFRLTRRSDPVLFGVRYAILRAERLAPSGFARVAESGRHVLWERDDVGYVHVVRTIAPVAADRTNLGKRMTSVLDAALSADGIVPLITFAGHGAPVPDLGPNELPSPPAGTVTGQTDAPADGAFEADVEMAEAGTVDLASSFDPRWEATVDGSAAPTVMVAPGTVGVHVEAGSHHIAFRYAPYPLYALWFALIPSAIVALSRADRRSARDPRPK
jgi:hypothetical protein